MGKDLFGPGSCVRYSNVLSLVHDRIIHLYLPTDTPIHTKTIYSPLLQAINHTHTLIYTQCTQRRLNSTA